MCCCHIWWFVLWFVNETTKGMNTWGGSTWRQQPQLWCFGFQLYILISDQQAFLGNMQNKVAFINLLSQLLLALYQKALYLHCISHLKWLMTSICTHLLPLSLLSLCRFLVPLSCHVLPNLFCCFIYFSWLNAFKYLTIIFCNMYYANNLQK